jgi:hypothetical protein
MANHSSRRRLKERYLKWKLICKSLCRPLIYWKEFSMLNNYKQFNKPGPLKNRKIGRIWVIFNLKARSRKLI